MSIGRSIRRALALAALALVGPGPADSQDGTPAAAGRVVAVLAIAGPIGPATSDYFTRALEKARQRGVTAVVLRMDTPGGLSSAMRDIIRDILASPLPVITYVAPGGAHAASAGTYILYASHVAAMAPATNLGAATPVAIGAPGLPGSDPGKEEKEKDKDKEGAGKEDAKPAGSTMDRKAINDARAYIRSLAELRGRNAEWAEKAVTEAATLSSTEALKEGVIDLIATDIQDLLAQADGRKVKLAGGGEVTLATKGAASETIPPDWRSELLAVITNPNIAYILLLIGIYGLIFEFYNPGMVVPGVVGAICLVLALFALHVLPVNYAGLALILLGILFMTAEAFLPSFGALGLGGIVAFVIGSIILIDTDAPGFGISWVVIGSVTAASAAFSLLVLALAAAALRRPVVSGREAMVGATGRVIDWDGEQGRVRVHGEVWRARGKQGFAPGDAIRVAAIKGLTLEVAVHGNNERT